MKYALNKTDIDKEKEKGVLSTALYRLVPLLATEKRSVSIALTAMVLSSAVTLIIPVLIARAVDVYMVQKNFGGLVTLSFWLFGIFCVGLVASYLQIKTMGGVGRRLLFNLRNTLFTKLTELPVAFFNQNKAGDLISRINNDTEKLNQFFAQALMQFISNLILIVGTAVALLIMEPKLGFVALFPAGLALLATQLLSPWVKRTNVQSLRSLGVMGAEIQESLNNFKVMVAFNRFDYFTKKFQEANQANYQASVSAGIASNIFISLYAFVSALAQCSVLVYGLYLILQGQLSLGLLIGFLLYVNNFYTPLRQLASVWSSLQVALAGLDRISEVLALESDMVLLPKKEKTFGQHPVLAFQNVSFSYSDGREVLHDVSFALEEGKTYALVGPTGGGKTTTASLMARLYDPTEGTVFLDGEDIRTWTPKERAQKIGFILQEPFLFTGTIRENILYGNEQYHDLSDSALEAVLKKAHVETLLTRFSEGLSTLVASGGGGISLGQKQLIAFMRATLRNPDILILDEATANIDTVTEQLLEDILVQLPKKTTKVIIAHRLNTIENADAIFFVQGGSVTLAGSIQQAVDMLMKREGKIRT